MGELCGSLTDDCHVLGICDDLEGNICDTLALDAAATLGRILKRLEDLVLEEVERRLWWR